MSPLSLPCFVIQLDRSNIEEHTLDICMSNEKKSTMQVMDHWITCAVILSFDWQHQPDPVIAYRSRASAPGGNRSSAGARHRSSISHGGPQYLMPAYRASCRVYRRHSRPSIHFKGGTLKPFTSLSHARGRGSSRRIASGF